MKNKVLLCVSRFFMVSGFNKKPISNKYKIKNLKSINSNNIKEHIQLTRRVLVICYYLIKIFSEYKQIILFFFGT